MNISLYALIDLVEIIFLFYLMGTVTNSPGIWMKDLFCDWNVTKRNVRSIIQFVEVKENLTSADIREIIKQVKLGKHLIFFQLQIAF